jgi:hypothetical protein
MRSLIAQQLFINPSGSAPFDLQGPLNKPGKPEFTNIASIFNNVRPLFFAIVGILLFVYFCWGGFDFLTSMGDAKKADSGKNKITHAIIGFIIIFVAYWVLQITDAFFGFGVYSQ